MGFPQDPSWQKTPIAERIRSINDKNVLIPLQAYMLKTVIQQQRVTAESFG